jgi:hypothetical protein
MPGAQYHRVPLAEDGKTKNRKEQIRHVYELDPSPRSRSHSHSHWAWLAHAVLLSISITLFALSFCVRSGSHIGHQPLLSTAPLSPPIEYETKRAGLGPAWRDSPYVGHGSEVDTAWSSVSDGNAPRIRSIKHSLTGRSRRDLPRRSRGHGTGRIIPRHEGPTPPDGSVGVQSRRRSVSPAALPRPAEAGSSLDAKHGGRVRYW